MFLVCLFVCLYLPCFKKDLGDLCSSVFSAGMARDETERWAGSISRALNLILINELYIMETES